MCVVCVVAGAGLAVYAGFVSCVTCVWAFAWVYLFRVHVLTIVWIEMTALSCCTLCVSRHTGVYSAAFVGLSSFSCFVSLRRSVEASDNLVQTRDNLAGADFGAVLEACVASTPGQSTTFAMLMKMELVRFALVYTAGYLLHVGYAKGGIQETKALEKGRLSLAAEKLDGDDESLERLERARHVTPDLS